MSGMYTRRGWMGSAATAVGSSFGTLAISQLLANDELGGEGSSGLSREASNAIVYPKKVKRVVQLFMAGAASHIDLFDFKPDLIKHHGKPSDFGEAVETFQDGLGPWLKPIWDFKPYGESGKLLSDVVAPLGSVVDKMSFIHNMVSTSGVHSAATLLQTTGFVLPGFPGAGCWVSYALGAINDEMPTYVVLPDHRGLASNGVKNWDSGFLPSQHSATAIQPLSETPLPDLLAKDFGAFSDSSHNPRIQKALAELNHMHRADRELDDRLAARIQSYQLAAKMQLAAPEALRIDDEPEYIHRMYGIDRANKEWPAEINAAEETHYFGTRCLAARRLLERGVRFVQVWSGNDNGFPRRNWDSHEDVERDHGPLSLGMARGAAALIKDLEQRGMLEDTLVLWTTEFGRMPSSQAGKGRDHNPFVFTNWLCGAGVQGGVSYGPSDNWGYKPLERDRGTTVHDVHATILYLMGIDHTKLTWRNNGVDRRLTDVHGHVIQDILA